MAVAVAETVKAHHDHVDSVADDTDNVDAATTVITVGTDSNVAVDAFAKIVGKVPPQLTPDLIGL